MRHINADAVLTLYKPYLLQLPYVSEIGIGEKNGRKVIRVFVYRSVSPEQCAECQLIPHMLDGYETEVVVLQPAPHSATDE